MGKRGSRSRNQLLGSLTKKQKKHLRDFGEEHPFYDRCGGARRDPRCRPLLPDGARVLRRWARARPGAMTGRPCRVLCCPGLGVLATFPPRRCVLRSACLSLNRSLSARPLHLMWERVLRGGFCMVRDFSEIVLFFMALKICLGLPWWLRRQRIRRQCGRPRFHPWVGKIPWRRKWQPTPVFLPQKSRGRRSRRGYSPGGSQRVGHDRATNTHIYVIMYF